MAGELIRLQEDLHIAVEEVGCVRCAPNDLRALLQLVREQHEVLAGIFHCPRCSFPDDSHAPDCSYVRVMDAYKSMGGE